MKDKQENDNSRIQWKKATNPKKVAPKPVEYDGSPQQELPSVVHDLSGIRQNPYQFHNVGALADDAKARAYAFRKAKAVKEGRTSHEVNGNAQPISKGRALSNNDTYQNGKYWNISAEVGNNLNRESRADALWSALMSIRSAEPVNQNADWVSLPKRKKR